MKSPIGAGEVLNGSELPYKDQRENRGARESVSRNVGRFVGRFGPRYPRLAALDRSWQSPGGPHWHKNAAKAGALKVRSRPLGSSLDGEPLWSQSLTVSDLD